jgi:hypothetical protein
MGAPSFRLAGARMWVGVVSKVEILRIFFIPVAFTYIGFFAGSRKFVKLASARKKSVSL